MEVAKYLTHLQDKKAYIEFAKTFILQKYPAMNLTYLDEAEHKLFWLNQAEQTILINH